MKSRLKRVVVLIAAHGLALGLMAALHALLPSVSPPAAAVLPAPVSVAEAGISARLIYSPEVLPTAHISDGTVVVRGWYQCLKGDTVEIRATLTQGAVEAQAETSIACTGATQIWQVAMTPTTGTFVNGMADTHVWSQAIVDQYVYAWDDTVRLVGPRR